MKAYSDIVDHLKVVTFLRRELGMAATEWDSVTWRVTYLAVLSWFLPISYVPQLDWQL